MVHPHPTHSVPVSTPSIGRRGLALAMATISLVIAGCGDETDPTPETDPASVIVDTVRLDDLPDEAPFEGWDEVRGSMVDPEYPVDPWLPYCGDPDEFSASEAGPFDESVERAFFAVTDSATTIRTLVRGFTLSYADDAAAEGAFAAYDADLLTSCAEKSVDPERADEVGDEIEEDDGTDTSRTFRASLDDYTYFQSNDNSTEVSVYVTRVGAHIAVVQFIYSGQYFEDVEKDFEDLESQVVEAVTDRLG